jgi:hypothetical protein
MARLGRSAVVADIRVYPMNRVRSECGDTWRRSFVNDKQTVDP